MEVAIGKVSLRTSEENIEMPWREMTRDGSFDRPYEEWALVYEGVGTVEICNIGPLADRSVQF